jgi:hypothetical protein
MTILFLALWTIVRASSRHYDLLDGSLADQARLSSAAVSAVLELAIHTYHLLLRNNQ